DLYGSLAATGKGHGTDIAILLGFMGQEPETVNVDRIPEMLAEIRAGSLAVPWGAALDFDEKRELDFQRLKPLLLHPHGMHFTALAGDGNPVADEVFYSVGGGFIATEAEMKAPPAADTIQPHPFTNASELMTRCEQSGRSIAELLLENENALRPEAETRARLDAIWRAMQDCVHRGCTREGVLPGGLKVKRRAKAIHARLIAQPESALSDPLTVL